MISRRAFTARELNRGTTIGHCKLDRIAPTPVRKVRVVVEEAVAAPRPLRIGLFAA